MNSLKAYCRHYSFICFFIIGCGSGARSQDFFLTAYSGISNYSGDLQEKRFSFTQAHPSFGIGAAFELNEKFLIRADFVYGRISANDKFSTKNKPRNLSFFSNITEYSLTLEYNLLDLYQYKTSPYVFLGVALFDFNPYTKLDNGAIIYLAERSTEGQGFYNGRKDYKLRQFSLPLGGGLQWAITDNKRIGFVLGFRKTFTDYLDDVSTTYVDANILAANRGSSSVNIAYRGDELDNSLAYPADGTIRGNPKSKDWYYFVGMTLKIRLLPKGRYREFRFDMKKARRQSTQCPAL